MFDRRQHRLAMHVDSCVELYRRIDVDFGRLGGHVDRLGRLLFVVVCIDGRWFELVWLYGKPLDEDVRFSRYMCAVWWDCCLPHSMWKCWHISRSIVMMGTCHSCCIVVIQRHMVQLQQRFHCTNWNETRRRKENCVLVIYSLMRTLTFGLKMKLYWSLPWSIVADIQLIPTSGIFVVWETASNQVGFAPYQLFERRKQTNKQRVSKRSDCCDWQR